MLVYTVSMTTVESLERKISVFLRKWLGLPRSLRTTSTLQMAFSGLTEEFKVARTRCKVSKAGIEVRTGRKWKAEKAVVVAESCLRQKTLVGTVATGRASQPSAPANSIMLQRRQCGS